MRQDRQIRREGRAPRIAWFGRAAVWPCAFAAPAQAAEGDLGGGVVSIVVALIAAVGGVVGAYVAGRTDTFKKKFIEVMLEERTLEMIKRQGDFIRSNELEKTLQVRGVDTLDELAKDVVEVIGWVKTLQGAVDQDELAKRSLAATTERMQVLSRGKRKPS